MNRTEQLILKKLATQEAMYDLFDQPPPPHETSDKVAAMVFDEVMAAADSHVDGPVKTAAAADAEKIAQANDVVGPLAWSAALGRITARAYASERAAGSIKIAQGVKGVLDKLRGQTAEESLRDKLTRDSMRRQHEMELVPPEVDVREKSQAQSTQEALRQLSVKELRERQALAEELRQLQLSDQYKRRSREEELFRAGRGKKPVGPLGGAAYGAIGGAAVGGLARRILSAIPSQAEKAIPLTRGAGGVGAGLGMLLALAGQGGDRRARAERERMIPASMQGEVLP